MTYYGTCEACGQPVESTAVNPVLRTPAFMVEGWEVPRDQGGTNHIRGRRRLPGRLRHASCVEERPQQEQMAL